jgi:tetratricopeptide (TPR) repeat protein
LRFRLLGNLAACHWGLYEHAAAEDVLEAAGQLFRYAPDERSRGDHFNNLGLVYWSTGRLEGSRVYYRRALYHYTLTGLRDLRASVLNNIGLVMTSLGSFAEARDYLKRAEAVYAQLNDHAHLAEVYDSLRKLSKTLAGNAVTQS